MKANNTSSKNATRRSFLKKGALLAVPLAAATAPAAIIAEDSLKSRLVRLEDEAAIRNLHAAWLRQIDSAENVFAAWLEVPVPPANPSGHDFSRAVSGSTQTRLQPLRETSPEAASGEILRRIAPDHSAEADAIEVAPDGNSASGRFHCVVEIETPIARDSTLAQMAHAQGTGWVRRTERRVLRVTYAKSSGAWSVASASLASA